MQPVEHAAEKASEGFNAGEVIVGHVADSPLDHPLIHLPPVFGIDMSVTKHVLMLWIVAAVLLLIVTATVRRYLRQDRLDVRGGFTGLLLIVIFSVQLGWLPSIYDTNLRVTGLETFWLQVKQMIMPVTVLALFNAAQISRYMRASMLDNLSQDYVRTARAKGMRERTVLLVHVLRNSLIPVVTVIALGVPSIFGGAIITEQIFRVNGLGQLLITGIQGADIPLVQTLTFIFAVLIVLFNLIADILYGILDPRIRYD